jgi:fucose permease
MSSSHGFWSLGGFIGGAAGGWVLARAGHEAQALIAAAVVLGLVLAALPFLLPDPLSAARKDGSPAPAHRLLPRDPAIWVLGAMALFSMVPEGAVLDWAALYLSQELGADVATSGLAFAFFAGAMALMRFAGDAVRNRFGAVRTLRVSGLIAAAGLAGAASADGAALAIACFAVCGLGVANMVPILFSAAGNHPGFSAGSGIATVTMVGYSGILVAPSGIGFVAEHAGFRPTYLALSLLLLVVVALAGRVGAADGTRPAAPAPV